MRTFITDPRVWATIGERKLVEPLSYRKQWTASRLVLMDDGTTTPLLTLLAEAKFGPWDPKTHIAVWTDKNCTNESPDNVSLVELSSIGSGRGRMSKFGIPSGTKEYFRRYAQENREKLREYRKTRYNERKTLYEENKKRLAIEQLIESKPPIEAPAADELFERLQKLLSTEHPNHTDVPPEQG